MPPPMLAAVCLLEDVEDCAMSFQLIWRDLVDAVARAVGDAGLLHHGRKREASSA
jgi:hypothetical protein